MKADGPGDAESAPEPSTELLRILEGYQADVESGRPINVAEAIAAHPAFADELSACLPVMRVAARLARRLEDGSMEDTPSPSQAGDVLGQLSDLTSKASIGHDTRLISELTSALLEYIGTNPPATDGSVNTTTPGAATLVGRYRLLGRIGRGGMGIVYRAHDDALDRDLAIKVPHPKRITRPEDLEPFLAEARILARLDHPNIVPVHDVGHTEDGLCFVVSKLIEGSDLAARIKEARPSIKDSAELIATIAEALHYAHKQGLVHRDIKPANILIDVSGKPSVTDFGLALNDDDLARGGVIAGTPSYMSPEQARGEGHRVDGRSDIFSLGVVFYELLTGRRPFRGDSRQEILEEVIQAQARPPRQINDTIPKELERICLKAMEKRASERYTTARDLADDLRSFLQITPCGSSEHHPVKIVPKSMRSFDEQDSDFFLELLPGPRDREGLPDSIRFWKNRIEATDPDKCFRVGLVYGPSGCGKSSLIRAGLLPRLASHVVPFTVESSPEHTENRFLNGLRRAFPDLSTESGLVDSLAAIRTGRVLRTGQKVLVILDQFEQWLHANRGDENTELVAALRQCDGEHVQALIIVRADFWLAVSRLMDELEIKLLQGQNLALIDLFDSRHARKVLTAFGMAYDNLPEHTADISKAQHAFLDQAVADLAQNDKVVPVRLALFAEMMKAKPWTAATLRHVGGIEGLGVTFLEESFSSAEANPQHQLHQKAAQTCLKALLPETGSDIRGQMRSERELQEAMGYGNHPRKFAQLIHILDNELRLITPSEPPDSGGEQAKGSPGGFYYQLTHDYLVSSLRDWLTRKQRETRQGRAELMLADRSSLWNARRESRHLPSLMDWANIRLLTKKKDWNEPQRIMMRQAGRVHGIRGAVTLVLLTVAVICGLAVRRQVYESQQITHAAGLVHRLLDADTSQIPEIVAAMTDYRRWVDSALRSELEKRPNGSRQKLHVSLALLPVDSTQDQYLFNRLLSAGPNELSVLVNALSPYRAALTPELWTVLESAMPGDIRLLPSASALAIYAPEDGQWEALGGKVAQALVSVNSLLLPTWIEALRPARTRLTSALAAIFRDKSQSESVHTVATDILIDYASDDPDLIANLLMDADPRAYRGLFQIAERQTAKTLPLFQAEIAMKSTIAGSNTDSEALRDQLAERQARAAIALLRMGKVGEITLLLRHSIDPRLRSFVVNWLDPLGADPKFLAVELSQLTVNVTPAPSQGRDFMNTVLFDPTTSMRRALILAMGTYAVERYSQGDLEALAGKILDLYRIDPDAGMHGAAEWTLRQWNQQAKLKEIDAQLMKQKGEGERRWFVNGQGQTFSVIEGPVEFSMGAAPAEPERDAKEILHRCMIPRRFAVAAREVTVEQYQKFVNETLTVDHADRDSYSPTTDGPMNQACWYHAAAYCNWLSRREGLPECYEPNSAGKFEAGMAIKADALHLGGYRLPTEAEWEYACRAGAVTSRYYGTSLHLLKRYAWYMTISQDRAWPCGSLQPNDLGLFDMLGNVFEWCQDRYMPFSGAGNTLTTDKLDNREVLDKKANRVLRGGSYPDRPRYIRSAVRIGKYPSDEVSNAGFRLTRTCP